MSWHVAELHYNTATGEAVWASNRRIVGFRVLSCDPVAPDAQVTILRIVYENFPDPRVAELEEDVSNREVEVRGLTHDHTQRTEELLKAEQRIEELEAEVESWKETS